MNSKIFNFLYFSIFFIGILFFNINTFSQNTNKPRNDYIDYLMNKVENSDLARDKVEALNELAWKYLNENPQQSFEYVKQSFKWAQDLEYNLQTALAYVNMANVFLLSKSDWDNAIICLKKAYNIAGRLNQSQLSNYIAARIYDGFGLMNYKYGQYKTAIDSYRQSAELYTQLSLFKNASNSFNNIAFIYEVDGQKKKSTDYYKLKEQYANKSNKTYKGRILEKFEDNKLVVKLEQ